MLKLRIIRTDFSKIAQSQWFIHIEATDLHIAIKSGLNHVQLEIF